jgi:hypothetical protein
VIDVFAVLSLASAAAKTENPAQLFADARLLYGTYSKLKDKTLTINQIVASGQLKPLMGALARLSADGNKLVDDPEEEKNLAALLSSI